MLRLNNETICCDADGACRKESRKWQEGFFAFTGGGAALLRFQLRMGGGDGSDEGIAQFCADRLYEVLRTPLCRRWPGKTRNGRQNADKPRDSGMNICFIQNGKTES